MDSSECDDKDGKIVQDGKSNDQGEAETAWSPERPQTDFVPIFPIENQGSDTITVSTDTAAKDTACRDQEMQGDVEEKQRTRAQTAKEVALPTGSALAILVISACMAIFLQAIVGRFEIFSEIDPSST